MITSKAGSIVQGGIGQVIAAMAWAEAGAPAAPRWTDARNGPPGTRILPGLKVMVLSVRKQGMTRDAFHDYWLIEHAPLVMSLAADIGLKRYVQCHDLASPIGTAFAEGRGWADNYFDGVVEGWWDSEAAMLAAAGSAQGQAASALLIADEQKFCDRRSIALVTREYEILSSSGAN